MWKAVLSQMIPADAPVADIQRTIDVLVHYMTGVVAAGSVFWLAVWLVFGSVVAGKSLQSGWFRQEFLSLETKPRLSNRQRAVVAIALASLE